VNSVFASIPIVLAMVLAAPSLFAQTAGAAGAAPTQSSHSAHSETGRAADAAQKSADALESRLEAAQRRLDAAQRQLEAAANEVAALSAERGQATIRRYSVFVRGHGRAIIGVQLDSSSGAAGARVLDVSPGGPAAEAGIRAGDVITAVNGTAVKGGDAARQVVRILGDLRPESRVHVQVTRNGKTQEFTVTARPGPAFAFFGPGFDGPGLPPMPAVPDSPAVPGVPGVPAVPAAPASPAAPLFQFGPGWMASLGRGPLADMELASLTPGLGRYFGTDQGVLVVRAPADGALKLEDGDVILSIDGRVPESGPHATRILASYQPGEKLDLRIMRERKRMDIETTMPGSGGRGGNQAFFRSGELSVPRAPGRVVIMRSGSEI